MSLGLLATPTVTICKVAKMVFNVAPGNFYLSQYLEYQEANGTSATVEALAGIAGGTDAAFVTTVLTNLGLADDAGASAFLTSAVAASGRGAALEAAIDALDGVAADDATYGAAKTSFDTAVITSVTYSTDASNNSTNASVLAAAIDPEQASSGSSATGINLSISADLINGGATDDVISGSVGTNPTTGNLADTIQSVDIINGGEGTDTLNFQLGSAAAAVGPTVSGVENINGTFFVAQALNMANVTGATSVQNANSVVAASFTNVANSVDLNVASINNNSTSLAYSADVNTTLTDTQNITLNGATNQAVVTVTGAGTAETVAITSSGAANKIDLGGTALAGTTTMTIGGDQNFSFDDTDGANAMAALKTITTAEGYAGKVDADLRSGGTVDLAITLGAGDDKITMTNLNKDDVIDMGDGADQLTIRTDADVSITTSPTLTNIETIVFDPDTGGDTAGDDFTSKLSGATALTTIKTGADNGGGEDTITLTGVSSTFTTLVINGDGAAADTNLNEVSITRTTTSGTDDSATISITNTDSDGNLINTTKGALLTGTVTIPGIENLTITTDQLHPDTSATTRDGGVALTLNANGTRSLTVVSETRVDLSGAALDDEISVVDASAANGGILLEMDSAADADTTTASAKLVTVTTGAGADTVNDVLGSVKTTISTGDGNDTVVSSGTTDFVGDVTIDVGAGNDTIDLSGEDSANTVAKALTLGAGTDTVIIQTAIGTPADSTAGVVIADFATGAGGDKIDLSSTTGVAIAGTLGPTKYVEVADGTDYTANTVGGMTVYTANDLTAITPAAAATAFAAVAAAGSGQKLVNTIGDDFFVIAGNGTDAGLFQIDAAAATTPVAGEITLLVTFTGITDTAAFSVDNFTDFLA